MEVNPNSGQPGWHSICAHNPIEQTPTMSIDFNIECWQTDHRNEYWAVKLRETLYSISAKCAQTPLQMYGQSSENDQAILGIVPQATSFSEFISKIHN